MKFNEDKKIFKLITQFLNDASLLSKQEEIIRKVLMTATKITNADYSSLLLLKKNPEEIVNDYYPEEKEFTTHQSKARLSTGISGEVIRKKDIVEVEDLTELSTLNPVIQRRKWRSAIAVPIISRREVEGILYVAYYNERLMEDPLTGTVNRRILEEEIRKEISRAKRYKEKFSILFLDLDHFKEFNDNFGHPQGDETLKTFSKIIRKTLRRGDEFGRYGGDEFISVLYKTGTSTAREVAERLVKVVGQNKDLPDLTISVGIAAFPQDGNDLTKLVHNADNACYRAKNNGGNRVEFASKQ
ncbi:MAG: sensor domain-containing diguanylate cyclase [candidate division WOR-3 bacterium]|nr:sensor domain-containing diguanylate cyclase [candidate division WOR-3 bacterium]